MTALAVAHLAVDLSLVLGVIFVALRLTRGGSTAQDAHLRAAEGAVRRLLAEAEQAAESIQEQLTRRQRVLEKLIADAEAQRAESLPRARVANGPISEPTSFAMNRTTGMGERPAPEPSPLQRRIERDVTRPAAEKSNVNIYGEPISSPPSAPGPLINRSRLSKAIERMSTSPSAPEVPSPTQSVEEIQRQAEELIRAGKELEYVAAATEMPIDEVRSLSRRLLQGRSAGEVTNRTSAQTVLPPTGEGSDPRLGVLGMMRRQSQVL